MKLRAHLLLLPISLSLTGCATLFSSGPVPVAFQSDTPGAEVYVNGVHRGTTPLTLELDNTKPVVVTFKQAGRADFTAEIGTKVRGGFVVLNVLGGLLPVIVDAATGEWKTLESRTVTANMLQATQAGTPQP
jgi:hypothetical protein